MPGHPWTADPETDRCDARRYLLRVFGPAHPDTLDSMDTYTTALANQRKFAEAEPLLRECVREHDHPC